MIHPILFVITGLLLYRYDLLFSSFSVATRRMNAKLEKIFFAGFQMELKVNDFAPVYYTHPHMKVWI